MMNVRKFLEEVNAKHQERLWTLKDEDNGILRNDGKRLDDDTEFHPRKSEVLHKKIHTKLECTTVHTRVSCGVCLAGHQDGSAVEL